MNKSDTLHIAKRTITNRLFMGTGKFSDLALIKTAITYAKIEVVTVALRRINSDSTIDNILKYIPKTCIIMANTSGARNADEAIRIARLARACSGSTWIKIEVIPDNKYLMPDNSETIKATQALAKEGFIVFPYMAPDLIVAKKLAYAGAAAIMPLGSPIGSNQGLKTKELVKIIAAEIDLPIIVDAGIAKPSQAAECMEIGCAAVLVNTAIAVCADPVNMAKALSDSVNAGRRAYLAGLAPCLNQANPSSPLTGFLN